MKEDCKRKKELLTLDLAAEAALWFVGDACLSDVCVFAGRNLFDRVLLPMAGKHRQTQVSSLPPRSTVPEQKANSLVFRLYPPSCALKSSQILYITNSPLEKQRSLQLCSGTESCLQDGLPKFRSWCREIICQVWGPRIRRNNLLGFGFDFNLRSPGPEGFLLSLKQSLNSSTQVAFKEL